MARDSIQIDFTKEEEGGNLFHWKKGDYHVKIIGLNKGRSSDKDTPYVGVKFKVLEGPKKGKTFTEKFYITPKSMKRLRLLMEALGIRVPKKVVNIPFAKLKGKSLWVELEDDESGVEKGYKVKSKVAFEGFMSEEDYAGPDDDDEDEDDEDDEDEDDDDDEEDDDEDDEDEDDEDDDEEDEDEDDDDEDEEEEERPKRRAKKRSSTKKSSARKSTRKKKSKKDDDDLEELDLDEL